MIRRPALRLATLPLPPGFFAARFFAAAIRPPLVFFMPPPVRKTSTIARRGLCKHLARQDAALLSRRHRLVDEAEDAIDAFFQQFD